MASSPGQNTFTPPTQAGRFWDLLLRRQWRGRLVTLTLTLVAAVGIVDFFAGFELSLLVFYILPVCLAVVVSWRFALFVAVACVASWLVGDFAAGAHFASQAVPFWNALFALGTYFVVISMFSRVLALQREMEERVRQRTLALTQVIAERERLEKALLDIGERERRSIGHDLHDGLGQHLTGTALAGQVLADKLATHDAEQAADAWKVVSLIEEGIEQTRQLARGLLLAEIQYDGLIAALQEFAIEVSSQFRIGCEFATNAPQLRLTDNDSATHLFRIAQEAVRNALRHGKAKRVVITLSCQDKVMLTVRDFGTGLRERRGDGLGLSIMAHRAEIIGGTFSIGPADGAGTLVTCSLPVSSVRP